MSREKRLAKNTLIISFGTFLPKICGLVTLPLITASLSKTEYGVYDLMNTIVALLLPIITLELQSAAFRFLIEHRDDLKKQKEVISNILVFTICVSFFAIIILFFVLQGVSWRTKALLCSYFIIDILFFALQQIVRGLSLNKLYSFSSVVLSVLNMILVIVCLSFFKFALNSVIFSITISTFVASMILIYYSNIIKYIDVDLLSKEVLKTMLKYSWPMIPNSLSNWIISLSDRLVVTFFMGIEYTAVYGIANKLPSLFTSIQGTFVLAWQENASLSYKDHDINEYYSTMFDSIISILFALISFLIVLSPVLFTLLIKGDYIEAYFQMPILYVGMFFSSVASFIGGIYVAAKKTKNVGYTTIVAALTNVIITIVLIKYIGLYAASFSTFLSYFVLAVYRMYDITKYQKIRYKYKKMICIFIVLLVVSLMNYLNSYYFDFINLIIATVFSFVFNKRFIKDIILKKRKK